MTPGVTLQDVKFRSAALHRDVTYRVYLPEKVPQGARLPVVYLLHGAGDDYRVWSNNTDVGKFAEQGLILVMPDGGSAYFVNAVCKTRDRYEDFIVEDLRADVEDRFPAAREKQGRAIAGISRGGYGAINLALKHMDLYVFAAGISAAMDIPYRAFSIRKPMQSLLERIYFGLRGSAARRRNNPMELIQDANPANAPYLMLMLTCGEQDGLIEPNQEFAAGLEKRNFQYAINTTPGGHDWNHWNEQIPLVFASLLQRVSKE
jgi:S-formylglutathione hydrolase FrmB